jgi:hypothetical protein
LLAVVANRKRCRSAFWRNPTAYTPCGVCCVRSTVFQQPENISVDPRNPRLKTPDSGLSALNFALLAPPAYLNVER